MKVVKGQTSKQTFKRFTSNAVIASKAPLFGMDYGRYWLELTQWDHP
jgi:hypothetical protein